MAESNLAESDMSGSSQPSRRGFLAGLAIGVGAAASPAFTARAVAAPGSELLDPKWQVTGAGTDPVTAVWGDFLEKWVQAGSGGVTLVDYAGAKAAGDDAALGAWLTVYQQIDPTTLTGGAAMAYWINLYNAATVHLVLAEYPVKSILRIKGGLFNTGPWDEKILTVSGDDLSLNDIEHGILRPIWRDARIHYAVNCASIGCPDLKRTPWISAALEGDLDAAARAYVNHPRGARVEAGQLYVSKIYDWYEEDFGGTSGGVISHLRQYADEDLKADLAGIGRIAGTEYDWALNQA